MMIYADFTHKDQFVAGCHTTNPLTSLTYSTVVSPGSIQIAFLLTALNDIDSLVANAEMHI
jgi:hypothetical protein